MLPLWLATLGERASPGARLESGSRRPTTTGSTTQRGMASRLLGVQNNNSGSTYGRQSYRSAVCARSPDATEGNDLTKDETPYIDYENLPAPSDGIIATLFITVRKVYQSRIFIHVCWAGR